MATESNQIDRDKLRAAVRKLGKEFILYMLDDAIDLLPPEQLHQIAKKYIDAKRLQPDVETPTRTSLLAAVTQFEKASLAGEYYQSFAVNYRNCTEQSTGTSSWIATCRRLFHRCLTEAEQENPVEVREALDILFGLLDQIDKCRDDIIFFADEGGSWQVGVDWDSVLPVWFKALSITAGPDEFAERISALLARHYSSGRDQMLAIAHQTATPEQRVALAKAKAGP